MNLYEPRNINLHVTNVCNNYCPICFVRAGPTSKRTTYELSVEVMQNAIHDLYKLSKYSGKEGGVVVFTGGEPTTRFSAINEVLEFIQDKDLDIKPEIFTNGGMIGAVGKYRIDQQELIQKAGLTSLSAREAIHMYKERGVYKYNVSIDFNHAQMGYTNSRKVPVDSLKNFFEALILEGYGTDELPLRILVGSTPLDKEKSEEIIESLMDHIKFKRLDNKRINSVYSNGERKILRYTIKTFSPIGRIAKKIKNFDISLDDKFNWKCRKLGDEVVDGGQMCRNSWHGPDIDFMGNLYFCGAQSWPLGNINHESLADIFDRLNSADFTHKEYSNSVRILHIIKELATKSKKNTCIGDLLRVLNQTNPEFVAPLVKRTQPCWIISRDKKLQQIIIDNFSK